MTKIKLCGMMRKEDIEVANELLPEYVGFIFWDKSFRNLTFEKARELRAILQSSIDVVGVFVDAEPEFIAGLCNENIIDIVQLHGSEDEDYIKTLRKIIPLGTKIIKAFKVTSEEEAHKAEECIADYLLFDPGKGSGNTFNWELIKDVEKSYFLAGGLNPENVEEAIGTLRPYAVDVSSGIETDKCKDKSKMIEFVNNVRKCK